jgi:hypothetical protein
LAAVTVAGLIMAVVVKAVVVIAAVVAKAGTAMAGAIRGGHRGCLRRGHRRDSGCRVAQSVRLSQHAGLAAVGWEERGTSRRQQAYCGPALDGACGELHQRRGQHQQRACHSGGRRSEVGSDHGHADLPRYSADDQLPGH